MRGGRVGASSAGRGACSDLWAINLDLQSVRRECGRGGIKDTRVLNAGGTHRMDRDKR